MTDDIQNQTGLVSTVESLRDDLAAMKDRVDALEERVEEMNEVWGTDEWSEEEVRAQTTEVSDTDTEPTDD